MKTIYTFIICSYLLLATTTSALAQSGSLDITFDTDGKVITNFGFADNGTAMAIQSDGKIVVAGISFNGSATFFAVARYNTNGSLDNTFDTDGMLTTDVGTGNESKGYAVAIQTDGKILVAGYSKNIDRDFAVVRYNTNGSLDLTFDTDGMVTTPIGTMGEEAYSIAIQTDGKIVVGGITSNSITTTSDDFALVRYNANGSLDNTFDTDGIVTTAIGPLKDEGTSVAIQSDGKIILAGHSVVGSNVDFAVARYNTNGSLDITFDTDGMLTTNFTGTNSDEANAVVIQADGKIVVAGLSDGTNEDFAVARYNTNGSLDITFDTDGMLTTAIGSDDDRANSIVIQSDGTILVAGKSDNGSNDDIAVVRYNNLGVLDITFDTDGIVTTAVGSDDDEGLGMGIQSDGKIVVAGFAKGGNPNFNEFIVVRYNNSIIGVGINAEEQNTGINIYPNPFSMQTILQTEKFLADADLIFYNVYGQSVKQIENINGQIVTISRDNIPSGLYFLRLTQNNKILAVVKLVITD